MNSQKNVNENNKESHCVTESTQTPNDSHLSEEIGIPWERETPELNAG